MEDVAPANDTENRDMHGGHVDAVGTAPNAELLVNPRRRHMDIIRDLGINKYIKLND